MNELLGPLQGAADQASIQSLRKALEGIVGENPVSLLDGEWRPHPGGENPVSLLDGEWRPHPGGGMYRVVGVVHDEMQVEYTPLDNVNFVIDLRENA